MRVAIDRERCTGHGRCYVLASGVFTADDDGYSVVLAAEVPMALEGQALAAQANCPERAVSCS
ncbi:MAG TPA: ferredoxin [Acidimicrobiales bacterium]|jgi:ferredoxin